MTWLWVFLAYVGLDFAFACYTKATAEARPVAASLWASSLLLFTGYVTVSYVKDPWMLVPAAAGALVGTYTAVSRMKKGSHGSRSQRG